MTDLLTTAPAIRESFWVRRRSTVALGSILTVGLGGAIWTTGHLDADPALHTVALFGHLAGLVLGFGAVLCVDWIAVLWLFGRRELADVVEAAGTVTVPIWVGYAGLLLTGVLLEPDLTDPATQLKLALVAIIGWNGVLAGALQAGLVGTGPRPHRRALLTAVGSAVVSQLGWWGAMLVGFLNGR